MKKLKVLCALAAAILLAGCNSVPKSEISFNPKTYTFNISSPKNVTIGGLNASLTTNGTVTIVVTNYSSKNDVEILRAVANANAEIQTKVIQLGAKAAAAALK